MPLPTDVVRVRLENGSHVSMSAARAELLGLTPLKRPGLSRDGRRLPPKHRVGRPAAAEVVADTTSEAADASESKED